MTDPGWRMKLLSMPSRVRHRFSWTVEPGDLPRDEVRVEIRPGTSPGAGVRGELQRLVCGKGQREGAADPRAALARRGRTAVDGRFASAVPGRVRGDPGSRSEGVAAVRLERVERVLLALGSPREEVVVV